MSIPNQKIREAVFFILYSKDHNPENDLDSLEKVVCQQLSMTKKNYYICLSLADKIGEYLPTLDLLIQTICKNFDLNKTPLVEKNILRIGAYEILYDADIPPKVAISEAIRLGKKFSTAQASQFINAILDNIYKESTGQIVEEEPQRDDTIIE